jgi:PPOX class probable F420-dependent enzyme
VTVALPQELRDLIESGPLAYASTINADGSPQVTAIWIGLDGDDLISTHMRYNAKLRNMERDPRVVLAFAPPQRPGDW